MSIYDGKKKRPENAPLTREEEEELWKRYASSPDPSIRDRFISSVLGLAVQEAKRCSLGCAEIDDLIQAGMAGACHAFDKFDPSHGTRFNTYAMFWIRAEIWDVVKNERNLITGTGLNGKPQDKNKNVRVTYLNGSDGLGSGGEDERGIVGRLVDSLHGPGKADGPPEGLVTRPRSDTEIETADEKALLKRALETARLTEKERIVISKRYLNEHALECPTLAVVAREMRLSGERVRQLEQRALRKIRRAARRNGAELDLDRVGDFASETGVLHFLSETEE